MRTEVSRFAMAIAMIGGLAAPALAQTARSDDAETVFVLGRLNASAHDSEGQAIATDVVTAEEMRIANQQTVDQAIDRVAGATASNTGGSRNERLIYVRGFDRFQTTLSIDGVRVFLPADNRIDFTRFLTGNVAEVQVAKGYVSVLDGPGGIGGAVNIVTRKPDRPFELSGVASLTGNGDTAWNGNTVSGLIGSRLDKFYVQASGVVARRDNFDLSDDFKPVNLALENGGEREHSGSHDWAANFKAGWTPNDTDEYVISYMRQSGAKNAPYHVSDAANTRFWSWPYWDLNSIYFLSTTQIAPNLTLKTRVYRNGFQNLLESFDDASQTTQSLPRSFFSYYDDAAWGASAQLAWKIVEANTLTAAFHFRDDEHNERQLGFIRTPAAGSPFINAAYAEPWQRTKEDTYSIAIEDVQKLGENVDLIVGAAYNWTDLKEAADVNVSVTGTTIANALQVFAPVTYPLEDMHALDGQAAVVWRAGDATRLHASVSSRARFPTLMERFSSRFGAAIPNPDIDPERATNYELGLDFNPIQSFHLNGAVFYSDVRDALVSIPVAFAAPIGNVSQTKNLGDGQYFGFELAATADVLDNLRFGGNLTYVRRELDQVAPQAVVATPGADPTNPGFQLQGVPDLKMYVYADWRVVPQLTITPSLDWASQRWTATSAAPLRFYQTGDYILFNLAAALDLSPNVSLVVGGKNLTDENYTLVDGFPEEGRSFYASVRFKN